jgi:putative transposase
VRHEDYLREWATRHVYWLPRHPQTNGKLERFHETLKARFKSSVCTSPESLRATMAEFIESCNYRRYHEGFGNAEHVDVNLGRREQIFKRREE